MLIDLNPPYPGFIGQAAMTIGDWKLIIGQPNCSFRPVRIGDGCPDVLMDGSI